MTGGSFLDRRLLTFGLSNVKWPRRRTENAKNTCVSSFHRPSSGGLPKRPALTHSDRSTGPWQFYDNLIDLLPDGVTVTRVLLGRVALVENSAGGVGTASNDRGGRRERAASRNIIGKPLRDIASLVKSWDFELASLGVAALNSWLNTPEHFAALAGPASSQVTESHSPLTCQAPGNSSPDLTTGHSFTRKMPGNSLTFPVYRELSHLSITMRQTDANIFDTHPEAFAGKKVALVGHFAQGIKALSPYADLVVIERDPRGSDLPDSACEYVLPEVDAVFITGMTVANKTLPRLLDLATNTQVYLVGPSVPCAPEVFGRKVQHIATSRVTDADLAFQLGSIGARTPEMRPATSRFCLDIEFVGVVPEVCR